MTVSTPSSQALPPTQFPGASDLILRLYRECRLRPADSFCDWALSLVRTLIPFDSAMWGHGTADPVGIQEVHIVDQPPAMMENYAKWQRQDFLAPTVNRTPGRTRDLYSMISRAEFLRHPMYLNHARRFGMEHILCTVIPEPYAGLVSFASLWRADYGKPFAETERALKEFLMPHLVEARRLNVFAQIRARLGLRGSLPCEAAACDRIGVLHDAEPGFVELLRIDFPGWEGPKLPARLRSTLRRLERGQFRGKGFRYSWEPMQERVFVRARPLQAVDRLSRREREVARLLCEGNTYVQVAQHLGLGPNTVRTHMAGLYRKLGASNKAQMVRIILDSGVDLAE